MTLLGSAGEIITGGGTSISMSEGSSEGTFLADDTDAGAEVITSGIVNSIDIRHWVTNTRGDHATVGVRATNADSFWYIYGIYPGEGSGWNSGSVWAGEQLGASYADYINAYAFASNAAGDKAHADLEIRGSGSLNGYFVQAYAGPELDKGRSRTAFVQQSIGGATGDYILAQTWADNAVLDRAGSWTEVKYGTLDYYGAIANAVQSASTGNRAAGTRIDYARASAPYGSISQGMWAYDYWGDHSRVSIYIDKGYLYSYPYYIDVPSIAYSLSDYWRQTYASQSYYAQANNYGYRNRYAEYVGLLPYQFSQPFYNGYIGWDYAYTVPP
ncbi:MAG: hypothetical protein MUO26_15970 [Methanotrichaceae archaeon]|nr:hypothetical protein [Methanotrichaceae archaeon]